MIVLNGTAAEQAGPTLRSRNGVLYTALPVQRDFLVLPSPDVGILHCHKGKGIELQYHLRDGENLPHFIQKAEMAGQQVVSRRGEPRILAFSVVESGLAVLDALAGDRFFTAGEYALPLSAKQVPAAFARR